MTDRAAPSAAPAAAGLGPLSAEGAVPAPPGAGPAGPPRLLLLLGAVALALETCAFAIHQLESVDVWWQLRLGRYISEFRTVPTTDVFTYTAQGNPYIDSHWLFQVGLWRTYAALGLNGVILAAAGVALATWACTAATHRRPAAYGVTLLALAAGIAAASERYIPRPDLLSVAFLAVAFGIVARFRAGGNRAIWLLPLLHVVWVNSHGLWVLGPILTASYVLGDALLQRLPLPAGWRAHAMPTGRCRTLGLVLLGMVPLTFLTPQPVAQALYPLTLFREIRGAENWVATSVTELAAPLAAAHWPVATVAFVALLAFVVVGAALARRKLDPTELILLGAFTYLALTARRNMALFAVLAVPIAVSHWAAWLQEDRSRGRAAAACRRTQPAVVVAALAVALACAWGAATNRFARRDGSTTRFGLGPGEANVPARLGDFLTAAGVPGPLWNTPGLGGYLAWRFWPDRDTFIDGRWEVYGPAFLEEYGRTIRDPAAWEDAADRYGVQAAVFLHRLPDYATLLRHLHTSPDWALVYGDPVAALFVRRTAAAAPFLAVYDRPLTAERLPTPLPPDHVVAWEDGYLDRPHFTRLAAFLARWPPRPPSADGAALLGQLCFTLGEDAAAAEWFGRALAADPDNYAAHLALGYLAAQRGDRAAAATHYRAAARLRPWDPEARGPGRASGPVE